MLKLHKLTVAMSLVFGIVAAAPGQTTTMPEPEPIEEAESPQWDFSISATYYAVTDDRNFAQPTVTADRDLLHLEARWNYEAMDTASVWAGLNFSFGDELTFDITPMIGGVFGDVSGVAVGYEATLAWRGFELYTEGEFVFDSNGRDDDFFYSWSEVRFAATDWFRFGVAAQRTKAYETDSDVQPGVFVGFTFDAFDIAAYVFDPHNDPTFAIAVSFEF